MNHTFSNITMVRHIQRNSGKPREGSIQSWEISISEDLILGRIILRARNSKKGDDVQLLPLMLPCSQILRIRMIEIELLPLRFSKVVMFMKRLRTLFGDKQILK